MRVSNANIGNKDGRKDEAKKKFSYILKYACTHI